MMLKNTDTGYGWVAIALHWLMALIVFGLFGLGLYMVELSYYDAWYRGSLELHKSIGISLLLLWLARIAWRLLSINPHTEARTRRERLEQAVAHWMHIALYAVMLGLLLTGYLISTADGRGIEVFELFKVPALPWSINNQEDIAGDIHEILAWSLIVLVAVHALAALKHHFIDKDKTLIKMLKPSA
jgi:cytochrome b561